MVVLILFLAALGAAFLGIAGPVIFPEKGDIRLPAVKTSIGLLALAILGLFGDRFVHGWN